MITIYFLLDKRKAYKSSKAVPVLADVEYDHNGHKLQFRFSTGLTCNPKLMKDQQIRSAEPNSDQKNAVLKNISRIGERIYYEGIEKGILPDRETFKARIKSLLTDAKTEKTTIDHLDSYIDHLKTKQKSKHTTLGMSRLKALLEELQTKAISIHFDSIDLEFETSMLKLLQEKKFNGNTQGSYVKRLKMFLNWCVKNNLTRNLIFKQFEITEEAGEIVALTELEIESIAKLDIPVHKHIQKGLKLSRDWFIISTQTGLRFSDLHKVCEAVIAPVDGGYNLSITTKKTGAKVVIPVSRLLYDTLKEYNFSPPSPPSNQKYNENLKTIAGSAKLKKEISSHTGRKSFATIQYREGVQVAWIMKLTGHRTEKEFYKYVGVGLDENASLVRGKNVKFQIEHEHELKMVVSK